MASKRLQIGVWLRDLGLLLPKFLWSPKSCGFRDPAAGTFEGDFLDEGLVEVSDRRRYVSFAHHSC